MHANKTKEKKNMIYWWTCQSLFHQFEPTERKKTITIFHSIQARSSVISCRPNTKWFWFITKTKIYDNPSASFALCTTHSFILLFFSFFLLRVVTALYSNSILLFYGKKISFFRQLSSAHFFFIRFHATRFP